MTIKRCVLCDGKIINKRCSECGMDFSRWEDHYHLNEEGCLECVRKNQEMKPEALMAKRQSEQRVQQRVRISEEEKRRREKAVRDARAKRLNAQANKKTRVEYGAAKPKKKKSKWILVLSLLLVIFELAGGIISELSEPAREPERPVEIETVPEYEAQPDDPYTYVVDEMPKEGSYYVMHLGKGSYYGGEHLPVGSYTVTLVNEDGYGNIGLYDLDNMISYFEYLDYEDTTVLYDVRLYEGTQLEVEGNLLVQFESENAQTDDMKEAYPNPLNASVVVEGEMVAGKDFEPGLYDIQVVSGYGTVTRTRSGEDYYDWYTWLNLESAEEAIYVNKEFLEGDTLNFDEYSSEDFKVELYPSIYVYE